MLINKHYYKYTQIKHNQSQYFTNISNTIQINSSNPQLKLTTTQTKIQTNNSNRHFNQAFQIDIQTQFKSTI